MSKSGSFSVIQARRGGRDAVILVDTALEPRRLAEPYPYLLTMTLPIRKPNARGLCDEQESERLSDMEDDVLEVLDPSEHRYIGRITWNGVREVLLYVADPEGPARRLAAQAAEARPEEAIEVSVEPDPSWKVYRKLAG